MNRNDIVVKTAEGVDELKTRSRKLAPRLRTMLIMIDGNLRAGQLRERAATLGVPDSFLDSLLEQGLIAVQPAAKLAPDLNVDVEVETVSDPAAPDRFRSAQRFMNDTVVSALGFRAVFFTLKLERCTTPADLDTLIGDYEKAITKASGVDAAKTLVAKARQMIRG